jgi:hypothetical protein
MKRKLQAFESIDPLLVPLPNGTEVTTRVDRMRQDLKVPQGAIGRVVRQEGDRYVVRVVGVGEVTYARDEIVPRKIGQAAFAIRRAAAWSALEHAIVLETTVGSHAWGLADEKSDIDRRGAFALPFTWTIGLYDPPEDLVSQDASTNYWETRKVVRQALRADPNTLEMLFLKSARPLDPIGEWILKERDAFVSREIYASFGRYALSQLKKLSQSARLAEHRTTVLSWLRADPDLTLDAVSRKLADEGIATGPTPKDAIDRAKEYVKQLYRSMHDQGLLRGSEFGALIEFAKEEAGDFELPRELRPKNAYNLLRLIQSAIDWLNRGEPVFEATGAFKEKLLRIKRGELSLDQVIEEAEAMTPALEAARASVVLPERPDFERADRLLRRIGEEIARRHFQKEAP